MLPRLLPHNHLRLPLIRYSTTFYLSRGDAQSMAPATPRPSASLIVVNARNEVLMVQRNPDSRSFAGAHVFPGGNFDRAQDSSLEMTAIRETFEETGVLFASPTPQSRTSELADNTLEDARKAIHAGRLSFTTFLSDNGLEPDIASLLPFSEWITPPQVPRRFHARFFVAFLPLASALSGPSYGTHRNRLPSPDSPDDSGPSSTEVISAQYIHPRDVLVACARGEIGLMPPQFYLLSTLQDIFCATNAGADVGVSTPAQREQVQLLARGAFGRMIINPRHLLGPEGEFPDGKRVITYEGDEARGGKKGKLHRVTFMPQKGSLFSPQLTLIRNFNIFTEIEEPLIAPSSKL